MKHIFVTGGNDGIGFALCKQLAADGHFVYLGSRSAEKGVAAVAAIGENATLVVCDVTSDSSVAAAAAAVQGMLGGAKLYGIVNNAGTGLGHGGGAELILNTNLHGPKRVTDAFLPLLDTPGRVVMVGSGAGPGCSSTGVGMSVVKMPRGSTFTRTPASIRMRQSSCAMASWQSVNGAPGSEASPTSWPYASHIVCRREPHGIERPVYGRTRRLSHPM